MAQEKKVQAVGGRGKKRAPPAPPIKQQAEVPVK